MAENGDPCKENQILNANICGRECAADWPPDKDTASQWPASGNGGVILGASREGQLNVTRKWIVVGDLFHEPRIIGNLPFRKYE